jgi:hypothetical protein
MNTFSKWVMLSVLAASSAAVHAEDVRRIHLRNDARLIQTIKGDVVTFECERMGGPGISVNRWIRDCNSMARRELESMKREGRLGDTKLARAPLGDKMVGEHLVMSLPTRPGTNNTAGPVADL